MYANCVWCCANLGANESIEHLPIGRRLAYDAARGWLWVVCRRCDRWNLTPIEERWEAIEESERRFRASRLRVSTDQIGMVRIDDGLDLIRIGTPLKPEFAAWRYGDRFARRRKMFVGASAAGIATLGAVAVWPAVSRVLGGSVGPLAIMAAVANSLSAFQNGPTLAAAWYKRIATARLRLPGERTPVVLRGQRLAGAAIAKEGDGWSLHLPLTKRFWDSARRPAPVLRGDAALAAAARLLPAINARGANAGTVASAVQIIEETPGADALFERFAERAGRTTLEVYMKDLKSSTRSSNFVTAAERAESSRNMLAHSPQRSDGSFGTLDHGMPLSTLATPIRLALEMAAHENGERRAMEGELALLAAQWKEAAEIATTVDSMLLPSFITDRLRHMKESNE